ncbi:MAG TPA: hypothetical protein VM843_02215 [Flavisolibacter sp.]|jgi:hypothetical protein|nr:hypothetical protein [Flavisolibacter sp.]
MKLHTLQLSTCLFLFLALLGTGCSNGTAENEGPASSTIDSNTVNQGDSIPAILHLDNADDTTFSVALDSLGPTVDAVDTSGTRQ